MRYEFFRALSALRFKSALSAYEPTMKSTRVEESLTSGSSGFLSPSFSCFSSFSRLQFSYRDRQILIKEKE